MSEEHARHARPWETFWKEAPAEPEAVFWDSAPEHTAVLHLPLLRPHFTGGLPLVDLGCGNGTQTVFLAGHYTPALGLDLSAEAISRAGRLPGADRVDFRQGDATDPEAARRLHDELGDAHVYVRGVLHQSGPEDRPQIARTLAALLGDRGRAFVVEPAEAAKGVLKGLMTRPEGPPARVAAVFGHGIAPMEMPDASLAELFTAAGLDVFDEGLLPLATTETAADGSRVELPSNWLVVGRNG